jgi:hypothetical protein
MIFAREVSDPLASLVKKIDAATGENKGCRMGSFVVFLGDEEGREKALKDLSEKQSLKNIILASMSTVSGPTAYKVAKDAEITVVLYTQRNVKVNYAFKKGALKDEDIEKIVGDLKKILPDKKKEKSKEE